MGKNRCISVKRIFLHPLSILPNLDGTTHVVQFSFPPWKDSRAHFDSNWLLGPSLQPLALEDQSRLAVKWSPLQVPFCFTSSPSQVKPLLAPRCNTMGMTVGRYSNIWQMGSTRLWVPFYSHSLGRRQAKGTIQIIEQCCQLLLHLVNCLALHKEIKCSC